MKNLATPEIWFVCGSQHLYGPGPLKRSRARAGDRGGARGLAQTPAEDRLQGLAHDAG